MSSPSIEPSQLRDAVQQFAIAGDLADVQPLQRGHIHDTFVSTWQRDGQSVRYLHQRMNDKVFHDIPAVMHNIETVSRQFTSLRKQGLIELPDKRSVVFANLEGLRELAGDDLGDFSGAASA